MLCNPDPDPEYRDEECWAFGVPAYRVDTYKRCQIRVTRGPARATCGSCWRLAGAEEGGV
jgi:hypothetical protein